MSNDKEYILEEIKNNYNVIGKSAFYVIYEVLHRSCDKFTDNKESCCPNSTDWGGLSSKVTKILKDLYSNLYRIYATFPGQNNTYFEHTESREYKLFYTSLKYWLYDQIIINDLEVTGINEIFTGWEKNIKNKVNDTPSNPYVFNILTLDEIKRLKNIYALYSLLYNNNAEFETCNGNTCKYLEYFGKGLDVLISSINSCSGKAPMDNYCKEFDEFVNICKDESLDSGIIIYDESKKSEAKTAGKYLLSIQMYKNKPHYIYIKNEELLNYVKTSDFLSNKTTTIAATSVVGSAIGLSSIFYYFYKFTPFGSTLRKGKRKNIVNIEERANDSLLYTRDTEQIPFKNREYKVAYHTFSDT
ncbi:hypothetical protein, conserved [Plasmodium vivax]|uniref:VIR protein n=1 Tax=Plasmodium vivax TaxID=5855 RepID=A0A1G4ED85_PLAVI|nr:hypothetical protein, conserved [Plasmodium vivax]